MRFLRKINILKSSFKYLKKCKNVKKGLKIF